MSLSPIRLNRHAPTGLVILLCALIGGCPLLLVETLRFEENDSGATVTAGVGAKVLVSLSGNQSTGYAWEVTEVDDAVLEHTNTSFRADCGMPGCGEQGLWTFTALAPGTTTLGMVYHRSWEEVDPLRTFEITVTVEEAE